MTVLVSLLVSPVISAGAEQAPEPDLDQTIDPDQEVVADTAELTSGHIDVGPRFIEGAWTLMIHDDAAHDDETASSVWRHPDDAVFRVHDRAVLPVPEGDAYAFLGVEGGGDVHVVPQTQDPEVIWLGWNTQDPEVMDTIDRGVTLSLVGTEGPGHLVVYLQSGAFEEPDVVWDSRDGEIQAAWIPVNTHAHANWVFTEPGTHLVELEVAADLIDGTTVTDRQVLRFAVGDDVSVDEVLAAEPVTAEPEPDADAADDTGAPDDTAAVGENEIARGTVAIIGLAVFLAGAGVIVGLRARSARREAWSDRSAA